MLALRFDTSTDAYGALVGQAAQIKHAFMESGGLSSIRVFNMSHVSVIRYVENMRSRLPLRLRRETADIFACHLAAAGVGSVTLTPMVLGREKIDLT